MLGIQVTRGKQLLCAKEIKEFRATKNVNSSFLMNEYILDFCTSSFNWLLFPPQIQSSIVASDHLIKQFSYTDVQSLILNQPVNFKNWSTLFYYLAFHCTFCDSKYVVGRKFLLSNFYRRKWSQRIKNDVSATFRGNIQRQHLLSSAHMTILPEEKFTLVIWFWTSFPAGMSFHVAKNTLRSERNKTRKFWEVLNCFA